MSISRMNIAIYSKLPSGGASQLKQINHDYLLKNANLTEMSDTQIHPTNFLNYIYLCVYKLLNVNKKYTT